MRRLLLGLVALLAVAIPVVAQDSLAVSVEIQLISADPDHQSRDLASWVDSAGGYFTFRSADHVVLRIPPARIPELRERIEESGDVIVSYNPSAVDYREELSRNDAAIASRNEALQRIFEFLEGSNVAATLSFERELRSLLQEIEMFSGRNRRIRNSIQFATVTVWLSSRARTIPEQRPSSFAWINTIDLYQFLNEAQP